VFVEESMPIHELPQATVTPEPEQPISQRICLILEFAALFTTGKF
jgi:hypothetical protein